MPEMKEWTIMFYFASDNPLAPSIVSQLKALKEAGFHPQANVIAHFDPNTQQTPSHTFEVNLVNKLKAGNRSKVGFTANDPFVRNLVLDKLWGQDEDEAKIKKDIQTYLNESTHRDIPYNPPVPSKEMSGEQAPQTALKGFLDFCKEKYPAKHYMLFILGHGMVVGNDIFLYDENISESVTNADASHLPDGKGKNTFQHSLLLKDLADILKGFKDNLSDEEKFELIGFHSCSMSSLEVAYEIQDSANYMMASQGPAFVGSWPYRQILIRVFNDLNSSQFKKDELQVASLIAKLKEADNPVSRALARLYPEGIEKLLTQHAETLSPADTLVEILNNLLQMPDLHQHIELPEVPLQPSDYPPQGIDLLWQNRKLLQEAFSKEIVRTKYKPTVKEMLSKIFYYNVYNSYDFQLAGYSYDLCLCDLTKLQKEEERVKITNPLRDLSSALITGLADPFVRELILLAHWEAQSYWQEQYTDLYDFCFCLDRRCELSKGQVESKYNLDAIQTACENVRKVLKANVGKDSKGLVVHSEFVGPASQYTHGLSVFFPWSMPVDLFFTKQYTQYKFEETTWSTFLKGYFDQTRRKPRFDKKEEDPIAGNNKPHPGIDERLLSVLQVISNNSTKQAGQLGHEGSHDGTGDDCECHSIKNYPPFTITLNQEQEKPEE